MKSHLPLAIIAALLAVGCGKKDEPAPVAEPSASVRQSVGASAGELPQRPDPNVPKDAVPEYPKAGQVNNHSSPEFSGGGVSDKK